jgi:hypothetical protein
MVVAAAGGVAMVTLLQVGIVSVRVLLGTLGFMPSTLQLTRATGDRFVQVQIVLVGITLLMALRYAYQNHRFADIGPRRIGAQVATMYVWLVGSMPSPRLW